MTYIHAIARAMVVGGSGAVGALLVERLAAAGVPALHVVDRRSPGQLPHVTWMQDDICNPNDQTLRLISSCDLVILATPEEVAIAGLQVLLPRMKPGSLLVDTLSVKSRFEQALEGVGTQAELLGINPMFAPSLGFAGRSVVAVPYSAGTGPTRSWTSFARKGPTSCVSAPRSMTAPVPRCRSPHTRPS